MEEGKQKGTEGIRTRHKNQMKQRAHQRAELQLVRAQQNKVLRYKEAVQGEKSGQENWHGIQKI